MKTIIPRKLYFAYGSNLNKDQMHMRCPDAKPLGKLLLANWRLVFRGVADIEPCEGYILPVGLWSITDKCELALDVYEGYPRLYSKRYLNIKGERYMTYTMNRQGITRPNKGYEQTIRDGYNDFMLPLGFLDEAVQHAMKFGDNELFI
jgi:inosine/xanthosine triphosphate pyrophosphatase family protein